MLTRYLNILALSTLVFWACSSVNALSLDNSGLQARHVHIGQALAKRAPQRCRSRSSSLGGANPTTTPAPIPATTSTTIPQTTPVTYPSNAKAGLAFAVWSGDIATILRNFKLGHVSTIYNWNAFKVQGAEALGYEYVPLVNKQLDWTQTLVRGYAKHVLGFNEPNEEHQANMTSGEAANLWKGHVLPLRNLGYTLISPATSSASSGLPWMQGFLGACGNDCVDVIAIHWYGVDAQEFTQYLTLWYNTFHKPLWITEFACMDFAGNRPCPDVLAFARTVRDFMDRTWWVQRYMPFVVAYDMGNVNAVNTLMVNGRPTALAHVYFD